MSEIINQLSSSSKSSDSINFELISLKIPFTIGVEKLREVWQEIQDEFRQDIPLENGLMHGIRNEAYTQFSDHHHKHFGIREKAYNQEVCDEGESRNAKKFKAVISKVSNAIRFAEDFQELDETDKVISQMKSRLENDNLLTEKCDSDDLLDNVYSGLKEHYDRNVYFANKLPFI